MTALNHVASAIHAAEVFADEAEDLGLQPLAEELRKGALTLTRQLDRALEFKEEVPKARDARRLARESLQNLYMDVTARLAFHLPPDEVARIAPGSMVDVSERVRFTIRKLITPVVEYAELCERLLDELKDGLSDYELCVDRLLTTMGQATYSKDLVVGESQHFRLELQRAKYRLLNNLDPKTAAFKRIRARVVRTRKPKWVSERRINRFSGAEPELG